MISKLYACIYYSPYNIFIIFLPKTKKKTGKKESIINIHADRPDALFNAVQSSFSA